MGGVVMRPIHINDYEAATGLRRRASEDFSDLDLQTQSQLIYGSAGGNGQLLLANMTLYAPDGLQMIMMERFEGLTSAVDCKGDDGTMSLTFKSPQAFDYALKTWTYVNEKDDNNFLLIANHDGCGPADERQPYHITNIKEDRGSLTTFLTAQTAPWSAVAGTYDLDFGKAIPYKKPQRVRQRSFIGDVENIGKDIGNAFTGSTDLSKTVTFGVNAGQQGQRSNIYNDEHGHFKLDCINCFITGSFGVTGHISVHHFQLQDLTIDASPHSFLAELELEAVITATYKPESLQYTKELFSAPIPDAGIEVPGIFKLGATLSYNVGISSTFKGSATVDFGLKAELPDSAKLVADIQNPDSSSAVGFSGAVTPLFDVKALSASLTLAAFSQPKLSFGIELTEVGTLDVALTMKLPEVSATLTAAYDTTGACSHDAGASKTGVKLSSQADLELDLQIDASLGSSDNKPSWSKKLWGVSKPLFSYCYPMSIPGIGPTSNITNLPASLPSTALPSGAPTGSPGSSAPLYPLPSVTPSRLVPLPSAGVSLPYSPLPKHKAHNTHLYSAQPSSIAASGSMPSKPAKSPKETRGGPTASKAPSLESLSKLHPTKPSAPGKTYSPLTHKKEVSVGHKTTSSKTAATTSKAAPLLPSLPKKASGVHLSSSAIHVPPHAPPKLYALPIAASAEVPTSSKKTPIRPSSTSPAASPASSAPVTGGGGCKVKRNKFGKRMLVC